MIIALFFGSTIWARILSHSQLSLHVASLLLSVAGVFGLISLLADEKRNCLLYLAFFVLSWVFVFSIRVGDNFYDYVDFLNSLFFIGLAYLLLKESKEVLLFRLLYYVVVLYFFFEIVVLKKPIRGLLADGNTYNYISCYIILFFSIYALSLLKNNKKPGYFDSAILVVTTVYAYGRGGIVAAAFYIVGFVFVKLYEHKRKPYIYFLILAVMIIFLFNYQKIVMLVINNENLQKFMIYGFDTNGRSEIWGKYLWLSRSSFVNFIAGADPLKVFSEGNLHNSFLQMWASMGFVFAVINIVLLIVILRKKLVNHELYYALVLCTFIVRALTDKMMFRWYGEIIMYYCIFDYFISNKFIRNNLILKGKKCAGVII